MYLVSIYFDEQTNKKIQQYINKVAERTGNRYMLDMNVPPHMTVMAFETQDEKVAVRIFEQVADGLQQGNVQWVSVGQFFPYVIYIAPVLNAYLQQLSETFYKHLSAEDGIVISPYYRPFQWMPHTTIGKKLSKEEMQVAFEVMQNSFQVIEGTVVKIGLAKPNPHRDIVEREVFRNV